MIPPSKGPAHWNYAPESSPDSTLLGSIAILVGPLALFVAASYPVAALALSSTAAFGFAAGVVFHQYRRRNELCVPGIDACVGNASRA